MTQRGWDPETTLKFICEHRQLYDGYLAISHATVNVVLNTHSNARREIGIKNNWLRMSMQSKITMTNGVLFERSKL